MASRLLEVLKRHTRSAAESAGRVLRRAGDASGRLLRRADARRRLGEAVRATYAAAAKDEAEAVHAELRDIADAEAERMAAAIREATGQDAVAAKGSVSLSDVRADLAKSNARRAKHAMEAVRREVARAKLAAGKTGDERADALKDALRGTAKSRAQKRFVDSAGRRWKDGVYNAMRARTMAANAKRRAQVATLVANGYRLARISSELNDNTCDACRFWRGTLVSLTGRTHYGHQPLERAIEYGVFHPNCVHYLEPPGDDVPGARPKRKRILEEPEVFDEGAYRSTPFDGLKGRREEIEQTITPINTPQKGVVYKLASQNPDERPPNVEISVGKVSKRIVELVKGASRGKIDLSGYEVVYETDYRTKKPPEWRGLAHAWEGHGTPFSQRGPNGGKKKRRYGEHDERNIRPLSFDELLRLPEALNSANRCAYNGNRNRGGQGPFFIVDTFSQEEGGNLLQAFAIDEAEMKLRFITAYLSKK